MTYDIVAITDRIRDIIEYYTDDDILIDLDAWDVEDLKEMVFLLGQVLRNTTEEISLRGLLYGDRDETFEEWLDRHLDDLERYDDEY